VHTVRFEPVLSDFLASSRNGDGISFRIGADREVDLDRFDLIFNALPDGMWKIWKSREDDSYLVTLHAIAGDGSVYRFALAKEKFTDFKLGEVDGAGSFNPLEYPLNELAITGYLNLNRVGVLLHSALVSLNGRGFLFPGTPGMGKSTISKLWMNDGKAQVLTDERAIVREMDGRLAAFGTPWHSTAAMHRNEGAQLEKIFFIRHGTENTLRKLTQFDAANRLMVRCFPTFWHREGMSFALDFCARIAAEIECYEFSFVPNQSAVDYIKDFV